MKVSQNLAEQIALGIDLTKEDAEVDALNLDAEVEDIQNSSNEANKETTTVVIPAQ